jgi:hypothetical protein
VEHLAMLNPHGVARQNDGAARGADVVRLFPLDTLEFLNLPDDRLQYTWDVDARGTITHLLQ